MDLKNYSFDELSKLGRTAWKYGDWSALELIVKSMRSEDNDHSEIEFLQGIATKNLLSSVEASVYFAKGLALDESRYDCAIELASAHTASLKYEDSFTLLQKYQHLLNNSPMYLNMAGTTYIELGLPREAFDLYQRAVELQPNIQLFKENLASCATFVGELSLAIQLYEELLADNPKHQRNLYQLSRLIKAKDETLIERIEASIADQPGELAKNIFGYYALAKQYEDLGEFQKAFSQLELGAEAITSVTDYDLSVDSDILRAARANSRPLELTVASDAKKTSKKPIFIIGLPRTGTTLLEQMLAVHSEIESLGETNTIEAGILALSGNRGKPMSASILEQASNISPRALKKYYLEATRYRRKGLPFFIEKMPTNYQYLHLIVEAFPEAKILILNRHPIDTCFAMFKQLFTYAFRFSYSLENLKNYYTEYLENREQWRRLYNNRLIEISYESLVTDTDACLKGVFNNLDLKFDPSAWSSKRDNLHSMTASSIQVTQDVSADSVGKWKAYRENLSPLLDLIED